MNEKIKKYAFVPILLAALGLPYAAFDGNFGKLLAKFSGGSGAASTTYDPLTSSLNGDTPAWGGNTAALTNKPIAQRLEGPTVNDFRDVIRFDISPRWVSENWSRVSTVTSELELEGVRVPLVTGGKTDDLAGSLTYYFDKNHVVQRVTFYGTTGDERRLVTLMGTVFEFREQPSIGGSMFVVTNNGEPISLLRIANAPVVRATVPNANREIMLEINRPVTFAKLSQEMQGVLVRDAQAKRW